MRLIDYFRAEKSRPLNISCRGNLPALPWHLSSGSAGHRPGRIIMTAGRYQERAEADRKLILLVDDDHLCLQTFSAILLSLGYGVHGFASGGEALEEFSKGPHNFSMVLLDQVMPGLTGIDTAKRLLLMRPDIPIALITGWFLTDDMKGHARAVGVSSILEKPVAIADLDREIRGLLKGT